MIACGALVGCSSDAVVFGPTGATASGSGGPGSTTGAAGSSSVGGAGVGGAGGSGLAGGSGGAGGGCALHCSDDLHSVLDCHDAVVVDCADDQGCVGGACVPACDAANGQGTYVGCDFYAALPGSMTELAGSCFAALVVNVWKTPVSLSASWFTITDTAATIARVPVGSGANVTYQPLPNGLLGPGEMAVLFLADSPSSTSTTWLPCPVGTQPLVTSDITMPAAGLGDAFRIQSDLPVAVYAVYPYGSPNFGGSATLLRPVASWGDDFLAFDAYEAAPNLSTYGGYPFTQLVAAKDGTSITVLPSAAIAGGGGVAPAPQGQPVTYSLNAGELLQVQQPARLVGSVIQASAPIGVWGGSSCMNVPVDQIACDAAQQQLPQVQALGAEYAAVQHRPRAGAEESVPYQLVGTVDGTQLSWDPMPPGAPTTLQRGQKVELTTAIQFQVRGQDDSHPFLLATHMTGGGSVNTGDPEFVEVIPPAQWMRRYRFATDPTYDNTNLVFTRRRAADKTFKEVNLDCAGQLAGWTPIGSAGDYEFTRVDLVANGVPVGACANGVHGATSEEPFGLTVWGYQYFTSYAYPAGARVGPINAVVVAP